MLLQGVIVFSIVIQLLIYGFDYHRPSNLDLHSLHDTWTVCSRCNILQLQERPIWDRTCVTVSSDWVMYEF